MKWDKGFYINWIDWGSRVKRWIKTNHYSYRGMADMLGVDKQVFVRIGKGGGCEVGLYLALCKFMGLSPFHYFELAYEVTVEMFPETEIEPEENPFIMFDKVGE